MLRRWLLLILEVRHIEFVGIVEYYYFKPCEMYYDKKVRELMGGTGDDFNFQNGI